MKQKPSSRRRRNSTKSILRLPDLEHAKAAVLNSLNSADAKRGYRHAIDEFVDWYCSEPRLAFNRIVVLRYRSHLESRQLAPGTINLRLGAVRRLAYEAADCGLLSADLAALPHLSTEILPSIGGLIFLLGLVGFVLSAFQLYYAKFRRRGVVRSGFYKRIRHPQYLFLAVAGLGLLILWPRFILLVVYINMLWFYHLL